MRIKTDSRTKVLCPHDVASIFQCILKAESIEDQDKEHFWVVGLNTRNVIKYIEMVYLGSMNQSPVSAREVFRLAISEGTAGIIICHNHPSGDAEPSTEDCSTTEHLVKGGKLLDIEVLDHVIIGNGGESWVSLKERGVML